MPFGSVAEHPSDPGGRRTRTHVFRSRVLLEQRGFDHAATYLTQAEVDEILGGDIERGGA